MNAFQTFDNTKRETDETERWDFTGGFTNLVMEWLCQPSRYVGNEQVKRMSWIWIAIPGGPKYRMTWEMKVECSQGQLLLYLSSFSWQILIHPREVEHSFHCQQMVRWYVSWIISWCHDRLVTCWVCCPSRNGLWRCKLWIWCHWWFDRRRTLLCEKSWYQEYRSDLEWLSTCFDHLNSTLCFEGDLSNFLPWPCWKPQWLHDKHLTTPLGFDVLCDGDDFKCGFWLARVESSKV